jgi:UDP-N-acetylglucosamine 2-epimerase (non-hydrolysing)
MKKVSFIFGTRPEAIKLCPLILALKARSNFDVNVCVTAQHRILLDDVLEIFGIVPDVDLNLMQPDQELAALTCRAISGLNKYISSYRPDLCLIQGDTTTTFCAALAAFYNKVPVGHVEAGLRTQNSLSPYPEEINRVLTSHLASYHFVPTQKARKNLLLEGIADEKIFVTGNTAIDALRLAVEQIDGNTPKITGFPSELLNGRSHIPVVLVTAHRRENFGHNIESICQAIVTLSTFFSDVFFVYPVHKNPNIEVPVNRLLRDRKNIILLEPLNYLQFVYMMKRSILILTDSGGIQEEAPALGKPVLVIRDTTERPEAIAAGNSKLVGTSTDSIVQNVSELLTSNEKYSAMSHIVNLYGDGHACERIIKIITELI